MSVTDIYDASRGIRAWQNYQRLTGSNSPINRALRMSEFGAGIGRIPTRREPWRGLDPSFGAGVAAALKVSDPSPVAEVGKTFRDSVAARTLRPDPLPYERAALGPLVR